MKKRWLVLILLTLLVAVPLVASAATYYYVNTSSLKIREFPDATAKVKDSYRQDYAVVSYKKYNDKWAYVHFSNGEQGYVQRKYLTKSSSYSAYITADKTSLRKGPAASFTELETLSKGAKVTVLTSGKSWCYVSSSEGKGYVRKSLLSKKKVSASSSDDSSSSSYTAYVVNPNGHTVNVRRGAGKGYAVITALKPGTKITVEEVDGNWTKISSPSKGWMMNEYVSKKAPSSTTGSSSYKSFSAKIKSSNGKSVNIRRDAGKGYSAVGQAPYGATVTVIGQKGNWYKISYNGITGYVSKEYIKK